MLLQLHADPNAKVKFTRFDRYSTAIAMVISNLESEQISDDELSKDHTKEYAYVKNYIRIISMLTHLINNKDINLHAIVRDLGFTPLNAWKV